MPSTVIHVTPLKTGVQRLYALLAMHKSIALHIYAFKQWHWFLE